VNRGKARAALAAQGEAAVAVTDVVRSGWHGTALWLMPLLAIVLPGVSLVRAATLPDDRVDVEYSRYSGGGADIDVPMVLVRKRVADKVSLTGHYVVDNVSGASIDVQVAASPYRETRKEYFAGIDYLHEKTIMSLSYIRSSENDREGDTVSASVSQEFFGNMTTLSFGASTTSDDISKTGDSAFSESMTSKSISIGVSQVLSRNALLSLDFQETSDEGYLQNPYRFVRVRGFEGSTPVNNLRPEVYPNVRTSDAYALSLRYYLPYRAAVRAEYRYFRDTWGIRANTYLLGYTHPWKQWVFDGLLRYYEQGEADFYYDALLVDHQYTYQARDKELSDMESLTLGLKASYELPYRWWSAIDRTIVSMHFDHIRYDYNNFRDLRATNDTNWGNEPLYGFNANVVRLCLSFRF
jgi:hypothetical protein